MSEGVGVKILRVLKTVASCRCGRIASAGGFYTARCSGRPREEGAVCFGAEETGRIASGSQVNAETLTGVR